MFYASQGLPVFPVVAGTKIPEEGMAWKVCATTDPEVITQWWDIYPDANIGLPMGNKAGMNCLDVDQKEGKQGFLSYRDILPEQYSGPIQQTPSGGHHWFFQYEPGFSNFTNKGDHGGLDMRTDAGYILAAPSVFGGTRYQWIYDAPVPEAETAARIFFQNASTPDLTSKLADTPDTPEDLINYQDLHIDQKYLNYLDTGDTDPWGNDESNAIFAVAGALMRATRDEGQTFGILATNEHAYACAERHRPRGNPTDWLWKYGVGKMIEAVKGVDASTVFHSLASNVPETPEVEPWLAELPVSTRSLPRYPPPNDFFIGADEGFNQFLRPTTWIIQNILEKGQTGALYGPSGSFKTFIALDLCLHISLGLDWHGRKTYFKQYCIYVSAEGLGAIWRRVEAWRQKYNKVNPTRAVTRKDIDDSGFLISRNGVDLLNLSSMESIDELVQQRQIAPELIIFDTLASNMYGNENSTEDMSRVVNHAKAIASAYDCSVMFIHHTGHSDTGRMRGASALYAGVDYVLQSTKQKNASRFIELHGTKAKDSSETPSMYFELETVEIIGQIEQDGSPATSLVPKLVEQIYENISIQKQNGMKDKTACLLNTVLELLDSQTSLGTPADGKEVAMVPSSEIYPVHQEVYHEKYGGNYSKKSNMEATLTGLHRDGYLDMYVENDTVWYLKPKGESEDEP